MKKTTNTIIILLVLGVFALGFLTPGGDDKIALAVKVIQDVARRSADIDWTNAKVGDMLYSGDKVKTGSRSIAVVKFKDNSMLRVRENAELEVYGEQKEGKFSKTVNIVRGEFTFNIQKQENEQFTFSSPTSIAAIRGTTGNMGHNDNGDLITVLEGLIRLTNEFSHQTVDVDSGQTGVSNSDGTIFVRDSTPDETTDAQNSLRATRGTGQQKELNIQLKDKQGNKKNLRIRYRD